MLQVTERFGRIFSIGVVLSSIDTANAIYYSSHIHATFSIKIQHRLHIIICEYAKFITEKI